MSITYCNSDTNHDQAEHFNKFITHITNDKSIYKFQFIQIII